MRLDGVEIKINLAEDELGRAIDTLNLGDGEPMKLWFYEDLTPGVRLPLLEAGLIIRIRTKNGGRDGDSTIKLRPCRYSQLSRGWLETESTSDLEFRIEEDRSATRRVVAASLQTDL